MNRTHALVIAALLAGGCSPKPTPAPAPLPKAESWVQFAYFTVFDPISETHISTTLKNLGIKWRDGKQGWRGYYIEILERDKERAMAALEADERAGNISALDGIESAKEPAEESIRRPADELLKTPRFAEGTLEGTVLRIPEIQEAIKEFRHVDWVAFRIRKYLGEDNQLHQGLEGVLMLAATLEEDFGGARYRVYVWEDGKSADIRGSSSYWRGTPETIKRLKEKYKIPQ